MKYYVVCDIHGHYTCLKQALKNAGCVAHTGFINVVVLNDEEPGGEYNV